MRAGPSTAKGRATVQRVLTAACDLFARQGIRATTLDQVGGARSGTGRGQLYLYSAGKSDLVAAVVAQQVQRVLDGRQPLLATMSTAVDLRAWCTAVEQRHSTARHRRPHAAPPRARDVRRDRAGRPAPWTGRERQVMLGVVPAVVAGLAYGLGDVLSGSAVRRRSTASVALWSQLPGWSCSGRSRSPCGPP